jgi:hypothetical protein
VEPKNATIQARAAQGIRMWKSWTPQGTRFREVHTECKVAPKILPQKEDREMNITQTPINIGQISRVIRFDESVGLITLLVTLGVLAWVKRANAKGMR